MADNHESNQSMTQTDAPLGNGSNNQNNTNIIRTVETQQVTNRRTMEVSSRPRDETNPFLPMQHESVREGQRRGDFNFSPSGGQNNTYTTFGGNQVNNYHNHYYAGQVVGNGAWFSANNSNTQNPIESSFDEVDGVTVARNNSRTSISSASSARLAISAQSSVQSNSEPSTPTHVLDDDNFLFQLSMKTSCHHDDIQGMGLSLLCSDVALSQCLHYSNTTTIKNIYLAWREKMRLQGKTPSEMVEILKRALRNTQNAVAWKFLKSSLDPHSVPSQETLFDRDEFFLRLMQKTLNSDRVGVMLLGSLAEVERCTLNRRNFYILWRNKMVFDEVGDQRMREILWNALDKTSNGEAKYMLETDLLEHDQQVATVASLASDAS